MADKKKSVKKRKLVRKKGRRFTKPKNVRQPAPQKKAASKDPNLFERMKSELEKDTLGLYHNHEAFEEAIQTLDDTVAPSLSQKPSTQEVHATQDFHKKCYKAEHRLDELLSLLKTILKMRSVMRALEKDAHPHTYEIEAIHNRLEGFHQLLKMLNKKKEAFYPPPIQSSLMDELHKLLYELHHHMIHTMPILMSLATFEPRSGTSKGFWSRLVNRLIPQKEPQHRILKALSPFAKEHIFWQGLLIELHNVYQSNNLVGIQLALDILKEAQDEMQMAPLASGLLTLYPLGDIAYAFKQHYAKGKHSERIQCLNVLRKMLEVDDAFELVDFDGHGATFLKLLNSLLQISDGNAEEKSEITELKLQLQELEEQAQQAHQGLLNMIMASEISSERLSISLQQSKSLYDAKRLSLRGIIQSIHDIIYYSSANPSKNPKTEKLYSQAHNILNEFIALIPIKLFRAIDGLIENKQGKHAFVEPQWALDEDEVEEKSKKTSDFEQNIERKLEYFRKNKHHQNRTKFLRQLLNAFHNEYLYYLSQVNSKEIKGLINGDFISNTDATTELAPSVVEAMHFEKILQAWICDVIFYKFNKQKSVRKDLNEMKEMATLMDDMVLMAQKEGYHHLALLLARGLSHPSLHHLGLSRVRELEIKHLQAHPFDEITVNRTPPLEQLLTHVLVQKIELDRTELSLFIGTFVYHTLGLVHQARSEYRTTSQKGYSLNRVLFDESSNSLLAIHWDDLNQKYENIASQCFMPTQKLLELSFQQVKDSLSVIHTNAFPIVVAETLSFSSHINSGKNFTDCMIAKIDQQNELPSLRHLIDIAYWASKTPSFKVDFESLATHFIKAYQNRLNKLHKENLLSQSSIKDLIQHSNDLCSTPPAALQEKEKESLLTLIKALKNNCESWNTEDNQGYSHAYLKILSKYLKNTQSEKLNLPSQAQEQGQIAQTLSREVEFEEYEEESHPALIGYAQTWNVFKQVANTGPSGPPFCFENIRNSLLSAFSWCIADEKQAHKNPISDNLLHLSPNVALLVQKSVLDLVFCSLDALGKLAGPSGEKVLHNLDQIDHIIETLNKISNYIDDPNKLQSDANAHEFIGLIEDNLTPIKTLNETLYDNLIEKSEHAQRLSSNTAVNTLLRLNVQERNRHVSADPSIPGPLDESIITPTLVSSSSGIPSQSDDNSEEDWHKLAQEVSQYFDEKFDDALFEQ